VDNHEIERLLRRKDVLKALRSALASSGGRARAEKLTPDRRAEIARKAAQARWAKREGRQEG
jgi:hypothetical protein